MLIDFFDTKGNYLTDIEITESDAKMLIRYAILDVIKKTSTRKPNLVNSFKEEIDKLDDMYYTEKRGKNKQKQTTKQKIKK